MKDPAAPRPATPPVALHPLAVPQRAELRWRFGKRVAGRASVEATPAGLVAVGALVSGILLSTAVVIRVARRRRP